MFSQRIDTLEVEEMIRRMNAHIVKQKPITYLEIKPYLHKMEDTGNIMLIEDHGKMGTVYSTLC